MSGKRSMRGQFAITSLTNYFIVNPNVRSPEHKGNEMVSPGILELFLKHLEKLYPHLIGVGTMSGHQKDS